VYASYESPPESALLSAASEPDTLAIAPGTSLLTLDPPQPAYFGGERATFNGSLASGTGRPVAGADVGVFAGEVLLGRGRTDAGGLYSIDTAVPFDMSPGQHEVRASFDPGEGRALAGSSSQVHVARFEPAVPRVTVSGLPSVAFPGDELDLQGTVLTIDGTPLDGRQVSLVISGNTAGAATTDARGGYRLTRRIEGGPGVYRISVGLQGEGLLMGADRHAGTLLIMPMDRAATVAAAIAAVLAAGLAYLAAMRGKRARAPMPRPAALPGPVKRPAASGLEDALGKVGTALSGGGDRREAVMSIYQAARTMLRERDPALPASATHRELYHILSARLPPLATPLSIITNRYERAAFGHLQPTDEDVASSLWGLGEIRELLYGDGGPGR
jgi:hypothetical protein